MASISRCFRLLLADPTTSSRLARAHPHGQRRSGRTTGRPRTKTARVGNVEQTVGHGVRHTTLGDSSIPWLQRGHCPAKDFSSLSTRLLPLSTT
jgi:hypothetical protein